MGTNDQQDEGRPLASPAEIAKVFRVDPKTVTRWAKSGKLKSIRALGGRKRYRETEVRLRGLGEGSAAEAEPSPGPGDPDLDL